MNRRQWAPLVLVLPLVWPLAAIGTGHASTGSESLTANLESLNGSGATGTATVTVNGTEVSVNIDTSGLVANAPHAAHFHIGGENVCPTEAADVNGDDRISTPEGQPSYGPIRLSLTTTGDFSADSALAVDRFPTAGADGNLQYSRTFDVSADIAEAASNGEVVIVQHGVDYNDNGTYDAEAAGPSELDPAVPAEATDPANCGRLVAAPSGGADTGAGGASDPASPVLLGLGGALLIASGAGFYLVRRARGTA